MGLPGKKGIFQCCQQMRRLRILQIFFQTTAKEAQRKCKLDAQGADLAIMPTPFHNAFVATMLTNRAWVGITTDTEKGVHFTWIDQRTGSYL